MWFWDYIWSLSACTRVYVTILSQCAMCANVCKFRCENRRFGYEVNSLIVKHTTQEILHTYIIVNQNSGSIPNLLLLRILHTTEVGLMATHIIHRGSVSLCSSDVNFKAASHSLKTNNFNPISVLKTILHSVVIGPHCLSLKNTFLLIGRKLRIRPWF